MKLSHPKAALRYAEQVVGGEIVAGRYVKLACQRFIDDLDRDEFEFKEKAAQRACNFIEKLPHVKGRWAAKKEKIKLEPWQSFIECNLFGFLLPNGQRRFRESYEEIARKNAKSTRVAGRALFMFCEGAAEASEVFSGATNERQAWEVFRPMHQMVGRTPELKDNYDITVAAKSMYIMSSGSRAEPLIGKPGDGSSPSCYVCDEWHEHPDADQYETMITGMGSRSMDAWSPLASAITTAGSNLAGPCYEKRQDVIRILEGSIQDDSQFGIIYCVDDDDRWDDPDILIKANPNLDISVSKDFLLSQLQKARRSASLQSAYKTKHLNLWVGSSVSWMNMLAWQRQKKDIKLEDYAGRKAWIGVDLASKKDLAAIAILIPDGNNFAVFADLFAPEAAAEENSKYRNLAEWITFTPGNATDYGFIEDRLRELAGILEVQEIAFDPWQAQYLMQRLMAERMPVCEFPHQVRTMSDPMKEVEALVLDGRLFHNNPAMDWMIGNVVTKADAKENIYPTKERKNDDKSKIDGVVALIMAMGRYLMTANNGSLDEWLADPVAMS